MRTAALSLDLEPSLSVATYSSNPSSEAVRVRTTNSGKLCVVATPATDRRFSSVVSKLAASNISVLIDGETGVGKTFAARLLHESGPRAREPFRVINCAAIPEALFEAELFGHERGSFTGAVASRCGAFEAAGSGTLFLDEIGDVPLAGQAKLLRALEERRFERIGSNRPIDLRARVVCATNRDLDAMVAAGQFRRDLLFRIAVVRLRVPPLRERPEELLTLAEQMLAEAASAAGRRVAGFHPEAIDAIKRYSWPGNVRELRNAIDHAVALGEGPLVRASDLPASIAEPTEADDDPNVVRLPLPLALIERRAIDAALRATGGNRARAAAFLGINRATLYNKLREYAAP